MRATLLFITMLLPLDAVAADVARVVYRVEATAGSWRPIGRRDLGRAIEHAALEELTKPGFMRLDKKRGRGVQQKRGDYEITIAGHLLDEAETHTVYLSFEPGTASDVPSINTSETVVLSKLPRGKMLERIEASARKAAKRLVKILGPQIKHARKGLDVPPPDDPFAGVTKWPWKWSSVRVPKASIGDNEKKLYSKKRPKREEALRVLTSLALRETTPRQILERCVLEHFDKDTRLGCLKALRPIARKSGPTRRVVIEAFRKDKHDRVQSEATEQMKYFSGPSRAAAVQAWLEAASRGRSYGPLAQLGDLPNLDLAIRKCLVASNKKKKARRRSPSTCIELLDPLPHRRRRAILWRFISELDPDSPYYLAGMGEREGSHGTAWGRALKAILELTPAWDRKLETLLWKRYQRTLSSASLDVLCRWTPPSKAGSKKLIEILKTTGHRAALQGLVRMAERDSRVGPPIRDALSEMLAMGAFAKNVSKSDLERAVKRIEKAEAKGGSR